MQDQITRVFRLSIYSLVGLSCITLGLAEGNVFPHIISVVLLLVAYFYLDHRPILTLESFFTSVLGIAALLAAMWEFQLSRINIELRILSASHLLAYFTWIVLVIDKKPQQYWWLIALSMLNMAVSASLTTSGMFGLSVLIFLFLSIWTLAIFTAYRGTRHLRSSQQRPPGLKQVPPGEVTVVPEVSQVRGGFHFDPTDNWLGYRLVGATAYIAISSILVGLFVFFMTPRVWIGNFQLPSSGDEGPISLSFGRSVSGFTKEVKLGDIGQILSNSTPVMTARLSDYYSGEPISVEEALRRLHLEEFLFRGAVLSRYQNGSWNENHQESDFTIPGRGLRRLDDGVRISYELEPVGRETLFSIKPLNFGLVQRSRSRGTRIQIDRFSHQLSLQIAGDGTQIKTVDYELISFPDASKNKAGFPEFLPTLFPQPAFDLIYPVISQKIEDEYQSDEYYFSESRTNFDGSKIRRRELPGAFTYDKYIRDLLDLDREKLSGLVGLAEQLCVSNGEEPLAPIERCKLINDHLKTSGEYSYTLNLSVTDPTIDPVEDFLFNRKKGHCEYFSSAATLMLRAVGIPARMVTGFRSGRWDEDRQAIIVEQLHAHAWVEAFVDGRWITIDPTTAINRDEEETGYAFDFSFWSDLRANLTSFWQTYILGMNLSAQQDQFYAPLKESTSELYNAIMQQKGPLGEVLPNQGQRQSIYYRLIMIAVTIFPFLIIFAVVGFLLFRQRLRNFLDWLMPQRRSARRRQMMLFFRKYLEVAARSGMLRSSDQTAREFSQSFAEKFAAPLSAASLSSLPIKITEAYYQARFRGTPLTDQEVAYWEQQIIQLQRALST